MFDDHPDIQKWYAFYESFGTKEKIIPISATTPFHNTYEQAIVAGLLEVFQIIANVETKEDSLCGLIPNTIEGFVARDKGGLWFFNGDSQPYKEEETFYGERMPNPDSYWTCFGEYNKLSLPYELFPDIKNNGLKHVKIEIVDI